MGTAKDVRLSFEKDTIWTKLVRCEEHQNVWEDDYRG